MPGFGVVEPGGRGDVEVDPGNRNAGGVGGFADEFFEEHGGRGGSAVAAAAGVHDVGDLALDLVAVVVGAGHAPEFFAGEGESVEEALRGLVVVGEEAGVDLAEGGADGAGEGGGVDEVGGAEGLGVVQAVGQDEAAFGVGVQDLDGLAGHGGDDVAGFEGQAVGHVLAGADDAEDADVGLELGDGAHAGDHGGGAGHVVLHLVHVVGGLDGDAAGVEGDALADQADDGRVRGRCGLGFVAEDDEGGRFGGALGDGDEGSHAELAELGHGVDLAGEAELLRHGGGAPAELGGGEDVAGLVDEGAGEVLALGEDDAFVEGGLDGGGEGGGGEDGEGLDAEVFAVGAVEVDVEVGDDGSLGDSAGGEGGGEGRVLGEGEGEGAEGAGAGEADGDARGLAELVRGELVGFAEADEEEALGLEAGGCGEEEGFAEGGFEVGGGEPGGGGGFDRGRCSEEGWGCGGVFGGRGVDGEGYEERGGEVGGGLVEQVGLHMLMVALVLRGLRSRGLRESLGWVVRAVSERCGGAGEGDGEGGAVPGAVGGGADTDGAAVLVDQLLADPEPEAGADGSLGGEEGVEHLFGGGGGDAVAAVGDGEADAGSAGEGAEGGRGADDDAAAGVAGLGADGVERVGEQVGEDLAKLSGDAEDVERCVALLEDGDSGGVDLGLEEVDDGVDEGGGGVAGGGGEVAVEAEGLAGDVGDAHELAVGDVEVETGLVGEIGCGAGEVEGVHHGLERIVDLVGDAGGHAAGAGEHFTPQKGFLGLLAGGVVGADEEVADDGLLGVAQGGDGDDGGKAAGVAADVGELVDVLDAAGGFEDEGFEAGGDGGAVLDAEGGGAGDEFELVGEVGGGDLVDDFGGGVAEHAFGADVEDLDDAVGVGGNGGEVGAAEDGALQGAGLQEGLVRPDTLVDLC